MILARYSPKRAEKIIERLHPLIQRTEDAWGVPAPYLQAILYQEITHIDYLDALADGAVACYWARYALGQRLGRKAPSAKGWLGKRDSSTGYAQVFAFVAIRVMAFAVDQGRAGWAQWGFDHPLTADRPADLRAVWRRLHTDRAFNLTAAALHLLFAAQEQTGRIDFSSYSPEEIQRIFTRYNADTRAVTPYGREAYAHYLRYLGQTDGGKRAA
ncbi:MAG: hypothetical protein IJ662_08155 [Clostridia bacterium]|nr:hypothetical protein [Clostridia bacterium]